MKRNPACKEQTLFCCLNLRMTIEPLNDQNVVLFHWLSFPKLPPPPPPPPSSTTDRAEEFKCLPYQRRYTLFDQVLQLVWLFWKGKQSSGYILLGLQSLPLLQIITYCENLVEYQDNTMSLLICFLYNFINCIPFVNEGDSNNNVEWWLRHWKLHEMSQLKHGCWQRSLCTSTSF